jgi:hypothetical protein
VVSNPARTHTMVKDIRAALLLGAFACSTSQALLRGSELNDHEFEMSNATGDTCIFVMFADDPYENLRLSQFRIRIQLRDRSIRIHVYLAEHVLYLGQLLHYYELERSFLHIFYFSRL